jgi:putative salt-induced outer membrane protein YdiY
MQKRKLVLLALWIGGPVWSAEPERKWRDSPEISVVSMSGNTRQTTVALRNLFVYTDKPWKFGLLAGGAISRSQGQYTAERYYADEKLGWHWSPKNYLYEKVGWSRDRFAGIRAREELTGGLGRQFIDNPKRTWFGEAGAGYIFEDRYNADRNDFPAGRGFMKYLENINPHHAFTQDVEWFMNLKASADFRVRTESAIISKITERLSLKTALVWSHTHRPPPGRVRDDTTTSAALVGSF